MGSNHARVLADLSGVKLVGIADPTASHRELLGQVVGCQVCDDVEDLIKLGIDAAVIAAPTHLHHDIALTCVKAGVHVLVEKPIASNIEEGRTIVAAAERAGVTLMVGHVERFNPAVQVIKDAIKGEDILSIAITRVGPFPPRMSNVGVVIDLAVHDIDLIRWFTDSEITEVQPQIKSAVAEREDIALLQFRTASGVLAQINTNWLTPFKTRTVHIATRKKYLIADLLTRIDEASPVGTDPALRVHTGSGVQRVFTVLNNGNVGIGDSAPGGRLIVRGDGSTFLLRVQTQSGSDALKVTSNGAVSFGALYALSSTNHLCYHAPGNLVLTSCSSAAEYVPTGSEVGGDFYDVVPSGEIEPWHETIPVRSSRLLSELRGWD